MPNLLAAIRRDHDPEFSEESLESLLGQMFPGMGTHLVLPQSPAVEAVPITPTATPAARLSRADEAPVSEAVDETDALDTPKPLSGSSWRHRL